ncbi:hypothetical protein HZC07_02560 [Candidatus Micrarchaeota archaeon]|nr:hypothetical protein [Candidatus Micrarchaeota archaeon]
MNGIICPKCGRSNDKIKFIESFCIDCYPVHIKTPDKLEFEQCKRCEKIRFKGAWIPVNEKMIDDYIIGKCKGDFSEASYDFTNQVAVFSIPNSETTINRFFPVTFLPTICPTCSRISGGYFQGIIQLRGNPLKIKKYGEILVRKLENKTFISKTEDKEEGLDIYVGNSKSAVAVLSGFEISPKITKKLVGREQGKRLYRTTFLLRFE